MGRRLTWEGERGRRRNFSEWGIQWRVRTGKPRNWLGHFNKHFEGNEDSKTSLVTFSFLGLEKETSSSLTWWRRGGEQNENPNAIQFSNSGSHYRIKQVFSCFFLVSISCIQNIFFCFDVLYRNFHSGPTTYQPQEKEWEDISIL